TKNRDRREAVSRQVGRSYYWGVRLYYHQKWRCCQANIFYFSSNLLVVARLLPLKAQFFQILLLTPLRASAKQFLPERFIISAGLHRQRHWDSPTQQQDFLLRLQSRQHATQSLPSRKTR